MITFLTSHHASPHSPSPSDTFVMVTRGAVTRLPGAHLTYDEAEDVAFDTTNRPNPRGLLDHNVATCSS